MILIVFGREDEYYRRILKGEVGQPERPALQDALDDDIGGVDATAPVVVAPLALLDGHLVVLDAEGAEPEDIEEGSELV